MSKTSSRQNFGDAQARKPRELCCESFWCGPDRAHALNLSEGGMCFRIARRAVPGETVELHLGPQLRVYGRIAWTRRLANCTEIGLQFSDTHKRIEAWVENLKVAESATEEPILALPAPEHTASAFRLSQLQKNHNGAATGSPMGRSWQTALRIIGD